ncbi:MAG: phosphotransferase [Candidatus Microsaccharimonas sp.]
MQQDVPEKYQPSNEIRSNQRYAAIEGSFDNHKIFLKYPIDERLKNKLPVEAAGLEAMKALDRNETKFKVPSVIELTDEYIATEWAEGRPMKEDFIQNDFEAVSNDLDYLIQLYAYMDEKALGTDAPTHFNGEAARKLIDELRELGAERYVSDSLLESVAQYIDRTSPSIETKPTNGDLQPGNIMVSDGLLPTVIDCEGFRDSWPRHYNVVNFVFNYSVEYPDLVPSLTIFFTNYCKRLNVNPLDNLDTFNISAAMRSLQIFKEHLNGDGIINPELEKYVKNTMLNILEGKLFLNSLET